MISKKDFRKIALTRRDSMSVEERATADAAIMRRVLDSPEYQRADTILIYCSYLTEVNTSALIQRMIADGRKVYCPRVTDSEKRIMEFWSMECMDDLKPGFHGIPEPVTGDIYETYADHRSTLMIMPGVAFNEMCDRIGYNGGYYDRYIPRIPGAGLMALAYDEQVFKDVFPMDVYDIRPQMIITQTRILRLD